MNQKDVSSHCKGIQGYEHGRGFAQSRRLEEAHLLANGLDIGTDQRIERRTIEPLSGTAMTSTKTKAAGHATVQGGSRWEISQEL